MRHDRKYNPQGEVGNTQRARKKDRRVKRDGGGEAYESGSRQTRTTDRGEEERLAEEDGVRKEGATVRRSVSRRGNKGEQDGEMRDGVEQTLKKRASTNRIGEELNPRARGRAGGGLQ